MYVLKVESGMFSCFILERSKLVALEIRRMDHQNEHEATNQPFVERVALSLLMTVTKIITHGAYTVTTSYGAALVCAVLESHIKLFMCPLCLNTPSGSIKIGTWWILRFLICVCVCVCEKNSFISF